MATKKSLLGKEDIAFLETYINNPAPTGFEWEGQKLWLDFLKPYIDEHHVDVYGTVYGVINPKADYKVVIEAHADEISWYVNYITEQGFLYVCKNGGVDHQIAPSKRVHIHTKKGIVPGIFGWPAIHTRGGEKDPAAATKNLFIDVGAMDKKGVEKMGIHVGCTVTYQDEFTVLNNRVFTGRALDNRIGGFMLAMVAKQLKTKRKKLPFGLYIVNAVQEEVGLRGAAMIAETIKPDVAIITDVSHDTGTPLIDKKVEGDYAMGRGPVLTYGPAVHNKLLNLIIDVATKKKITIQRDAASRSTGTDTDAFAYANGGTPSALISLPLRYMHTTVESCSKADVEDLIRLIYETLGVLKPGYDFRYL